MARTDAIPSGRRAARRPAAPVSWPAALAALVALPLAPACGGSPPALPGREARAAAEAMPRAGAPAGAAAGTFDGYAPIIRGVMPAVVNISSLQVIRTYE